MTGSGTAAVESMMAAMVPANGRLLNLENGVYGDRIAQMCAQYGIAHERVIGSWMEPLDLSAVQRGFHSRGRGASRDHYGSAE